MNKLLAVETSAEACSLALWRDGEMFHFFQHAPMRHAELLLPAVHSLLEQAGLDLSDLDAIAFGRGPGGFTSLRIGIGVVQGLAWAAELPVIPISSLAAVAQEVVERGRLPVKPGAHAQERNLSEQSRGNCQGEPDTLICVAVDARMREAYTANFRIGESGIVTAAGTERVCSPAEVVVPVAEPFIAAGNGFKQFKELERLAEAAGECHPDIVPRAESICKLAQDWLTRHEPLPAGLAQPVYVRNDVATKAEPG